MVSEFFISRTGALEPHGNRQKRGRETAISSKRFKPPHDQYRRYYRSVILTR